MTVADRCQCINGDMFKDVPSVDAYIMKLMLHDWVNGECVKILSDTYNGSDDGVRVLNVAYLVPGPNTSLFSKLFDIHMMCWGSGKGEDG